MLFLSDLLWDPNGQAFWAIEQLPAAGRRSFDCLKILQSLLATKSGGIGGELQSNQGKPQKMWRKMRRAEENDKIMGEWVVKERKNA